MSDSLEELHVRNSWLVRMPPAVKNLTNLKILDVDKSRITYLPPGVFDGMKNLLVRTNAMETNNKKMKKKTKSLNQTRRQDLKIADSGLNSLDGGILHNLGKLKRLSLNGNNLTSIPRNGFRSQSNRLEYLDLSHNSLGQLQPHYFAQLRNVLWLNISHNQIPEVNGRIFARLVKMLRQRCLFSTLNCATGLALFASCT